MSEIQIPLKPNDFAAIRNNVKQSQEVSPTFQTMPFPNQHHPKSGEARDLLLLLLLVMFIGCGICILIKQRKIEKQEAENADDLKFIKQQISIQTTMKAINQPKPQQNDNTTIHADDNAST